MDWLSNLDGPTFLTALLGAAIGAVVGGLFTFAGVFWEQRSANDRAENQLRKQRAAEECAEILRLLSSYKISDYWERKRASASQSFRAPRPLLDRRGIMTHVHRLKVWMKNPGGFQTRLEAVLDDLENTWLPPRMVQQQGELLRRDPREYPDAVYEIHEDYRRRVDAAIAALPHVDEAEFMRSMFAARYEFHDAFTVLGVSFGFVHESDFGEGAQPS